MDLITDIIYVLGFLFSSAVGIWMYAEANKEKDSKFTCGTGKGKQWATISIVVNSSALGCTLLWLLYKMFFKEIDGEVIWAGGPVMSVADLLVNEFAKIAKWGFLASCSSVFLMSMACDNFNKSGNPTEILAGEFVSAIAGLAAIMVVLWANKSGRTDRLKGRASRMFTRSRPAAAASPEAIEMDDLGARAGGYF